MAEKKIEFTVKANDAASGTFEKIGGNVEKLREKLALPFGPLTREQTATERQAMARVMAKNAAAQKEALDKALFGSGESSLTKLLGKLGTSNGTDAPIERLVKIAPKLGVALAIAKAASVTLGVINFELDAARHNRQGSLERQVEDEQKRDAALKSIPLLGPLAGEIQKLNPFSQRRRNEAAIEDLQDATKQTDLYTAALERRAKIEKELNETGQANADALGLAFRQSRTTAERGAFLGSSEAQRLLEKKIKELPADIDPSKLAGLQAERGNRAVVTTAALGRSLLGDFNNAKDLFTGIGNALTQITKDEFAKFLDGLVKVAEAERLDLIQGQARREEYDAQHNRVLNIRQSQFETGQSLTDARRLELLAGGDQLGAGRLEVAAAFAARRQGLLAILQDENSSPAQKVQALRAGLNLDVQQRLANQLLETPTFRGSTASSNNSPFTTGQAEAAREKVIVDPKVLALMEELRKQNEKSADKIGEAVGRALTAAFSKLPALKGIFGLN